MYVSEIWRYPIKSMKGEPLQEAAITPLGIPGDREIVILRSSTGRIWTSRTQPAFLGLRAETGRDGTATVNGLPWGSPAAQQLVDEAAGEPTRLVRMPGTERFDVLPLLVATDGAVEYLKIDRRRLRPNIVIAGVEGLAERAWPGRIIVIGDVRIHAEKLRDRCVMTTYDPDTQERDPSVLLRIVKQLDGSTALDCSVISVGTIRVGDAVEIVDG
jgi:uncharacterized protein YcbX